MGEPIARGLFLIKNEGNARENISGIVYGEYQGIAYIPFFLTKTQNMGLGSELLRQLEKMLFEKQSTMVFFSTPNQVNMYYNRGFSRLDQPSRLIDFSAQGKQLIQKIHNNSPLLQLFPAEDVVILYKMCSEICFTKFISTFGFNVEFMTTEEKTQISCFEESINMLDFR